MEAGKQGWPPLKAECKKKKKNEQREKILKVARASGKIKKRMMQTISETPEPSEVIVVELRDDDSDLMDDGDGKD